jgi:regulator of sigma E protease
MSLFLTILLFVLILLILVLVHEFGHFLTAKFFGIRVDEFGVGFPPKLFGKKYGETEYTVNLLPIGGFVRIFGEDPLEESENESDKTRKFSDKSLFVQAAVIIAGVVMNFILAWVLFSAIFMIGTPTVQSSAPKGVHLKNVHLTALEVLPGSPADKAGLSSGDALIGISGAQETVSKPTTQQFQNFISNHANDPLQVTYLMGNTKHVAKITPQKGVSKDEPQKAIIGVALGNVGTYQLPVGQALIHGLQRTGVMTKTLGVGLGTFFGQALTGHANLNEVSGPVGIVPIVGQVSSLGFAYVLSFMALISLNLALINIIPFPALDGGRLLFIIIEAIKGSPIKPRVANLINATGFALLILLMIVVTYHDIARLVTG